MNLFHSELDEGEAESVGGAVVFSLMSMRLMRKERQQSGSVAARCSWILTFTCVVA